MFSLYFSVEKVFRSKNPEAVCVSCFTIDLFHIVSAHAYIGHVARCFSIIGKTFHKWGKRILSHTFYVISDNCFNHLFSHFFLS